MTRRRSVHAGQRAQYVDLHGASAARMLAEAETKLRALEAGTAEPAHPQDTIEHRRKVRTDWIEAFRTVGACKRCGRALDGESAQADLNRERGVGSDCWAKLTTGEQEAITAWVGRQRDGDAEPM